jgi:hypothetical protein
MVKGKDKPVSIFELVGWQSDVDTPTREKIQTFERAFHLYQNREFSAAKALFQDLVESYADKPAMTFLERTENYIKNGCPPEWNGHYRATEK